MATIVMIVMTIIFHQNLRFYYKGVYSFSFGNFSCNPCNLVSSDLCCSKSPSILVISLFINLHTIIIYQYLPFY